MRVRFKRGKLCLWGGGEGGEREEYGLISQLLPEEMRALADLAARRPYFERRLSELSVEVKRITSLATQE